MILDWGFWTKREREDARKFYEDRNIAYEFHYIDISDEKWSRRLAKRNKAVLENEVSAYFVDENLAKKFESIFEKPGEEEIENYGKLVKEI